MVSRVNRVKLIDFGIARLFKKEKLEDTFVYGTPGYAAPEQYCAGQAALRSDIFSLGVTRGFSARLLRGFCSAWKAVCSGPGASTGLASRYGPTQGPSGPSFCSESRGRGSLSEQR